LGQDSRMFSPRSPRFAAWLLPILTLALLAIGFGHRVPVAGNTGLAAYVAAWGDASDLCAKGMDGQARGDECPVCHLTAGAALPTPVAVVRFDPRPLVLRLVSAPARLPVPAHITRHGARAPPVV